jgi:hypothetical protein
MYAHKSGETLLANLHDWVAFKGEMGFCSPLLNALGRGFRGGDRSWRCANRPDWQKNNPDVIVVFAILRGDFANNCQFCHQSSRLTMTKTKTIPPTIVAACRQSDNAVLMTLAFTMN